MKPIETKWKGWRFRSRTEARWAVFLEAVGLRFEYEPEGIHLPSGPYLPDFRFEAILAMRRLDGSADAFRVSYWLEVKGASPTEEEERKCWELAQASDATVLLAVGAPDARPQVYRYSPRVELEMHQLFRKHDGLAYFAERDDLPGGIGLTNPDARAIADPTDGTVYPPSRGFWLGFCAEQETYPQPNHSKALRVGPKLQRAYDAARSARFEFGETDQRWR